MDPAIREAGDIGIPIVVSHPDSEAAKALSELAEKVAENADVIAEAGSNIIPIEMVD
jgi:ATP-binding protein involved in chromosome partitioning